jgi:two-component system, OmpR family, sensor kinase
MTQRHDLGRLRRQLTVMYSVTLSVGLIALALAVVVIDGRLRDGRADEQLLGLAARASSLVDDSTDPPDVSGITDDILDQRVLWEVTMKVDGDFDVLGGDNLGASETLVRLAMKDDDEAGSYGFVTNSNDRSLRAAALPIYVDDRIVGAVVVAASERGDPDHRRLIGIIVPSTLVLVGLGAVVGWFLAGRSIRPAIATLEHQERFLSAAAHELRTPVSRVRAVAETAYLIATELPDDELSRELLDELVRLRQLSVETGSVVEDLLAVARLDAGRLDVRHQPVALGDIIETVLRDRPQITRHLEPELDVVGDPVLLRRLVENLVVNSERHGRLPGSATASTVVRAATVGAFVTLTVSDSGPGIPERLLPEIFERFRSGDPGGSGVGLWLSRWVAEAHDGTLTARNDAGAVFELRLPRASSGA